MNDGQTGPAPSKGTLVFDSRFQTCRSHGDLLACFVDGIYSNFILPCRSLTGIVTGKKHVILWEKTPDNIDGALSATGEQAAGCLLRTGSEGPQGAGGVVLPRPGKPTPGRHAPVSAKELAASERF
jgi:hypothetical protein